MADTTDLRPVAERREGSSPFIPTNLTKKTKMKYEIYYCSTRRRITG